LEGGAGDRGDKGENLANLTRQLCAVLSRAACGKHNQDDEAARQSFKDHLIPP
jgi:hypothetical protein